jgi:hypothetical protein
MDALADQGPDFVDGHTYQIPCPAKGCGTLVTFDLTPTVGSVTCPHCTTVVFSRHPAVRVGTRGGHPRELPPITSNTTSPPQTPTSKPSRVRSLDDAIGKEPGLTSEQDDKARKLLDW